MNNYDLIYAGVSKAANDFMLGKKKSKSAAKTEEALFTYLNQDDGSQEFLLTVKVPILHMLGRIYLKQGRIQDAKRYLRDAYAMALAFPGMVPAYEGNDEIAAFVRNDVGMELPVEFG